MKPTASQSFVWRDAAGTVLVNKGDPLTPAQHAHAEKHGFIQKPAPAKKNTPVPEVTENEQP